MQSTMKIKKKDLFTGTRSPNRSHVRSIQDVSHMNDKIGNCKDREEKNYESPKSPGNNQQWLQIGRNFHQQQNTFNEEPGFKTEKHL